MISPSFEVPFDNCALGWNCKVMGWDGALCINQAVCLNAWESLRDQDSLDRAQCNHVDELSCLNRYLIREEYDRSEAGWSATTHWIVKTPGSRTPLASGYAPAEPAQLPLELTVNGAIVVRTVGEFCVAEINPTLRLELESSPVVMIEWDGSSLQDLGNIRLIDTEDGYKHFCNTLKDGSLICTNDGDQAVEGLYWLREDQKPAATYGDRVQKIELTPEILERLIPLLNGANTCEESFWCTVCEDYTSEGDHGWSTCQHLRYMEELSSWGGAGYAEDDYRKDYEEAFLALLQSDREDVQALVVKLQGLLEKKNVTDLMDAMWRIGNMHEDAIEPAIRYMQTLDDKTVVGWQNCIKWLAAAQESPKPSAPPLEYIN